MTRKSNSPFIFWTEGVHIQHNDCLGPWSRSNIKICLISFFLARLHIVQIAIVVTTVVRVPLPFPSHCVKVGRVGLEVKSSIYPKDRIFAFSISPYFDNHMSEIIHACTIDTL